MTVKSTDPQSPAGAPEADGGADVPALPVRASIYIDKDGTVHFGALFEDLLPVARALGATKSEE